ncbi:hypothetical protein [Collimonas arenae]|uniref:hypothetical protein n=1 Tax=Collimonas arenae TaxID=279058 RepID=UPI000ADEF9B1
MKRIISLCFAALMLLLGGCATVIRSDVTAFNEWPADLPNKSYVFEHTRHRKMTWNTRIMKTWWAANCNAWDSRSRPVVLCPN